MFFARAAAYIIGHVWKCWANGFGCLFTVDYFFDLFIKCYVWYDFIFYVYLCSHIIGYNEKENRRERDRRRTHRLIGVVVSNLTTHGMLILVAGARQLGDRYEVTC